jgi:hypothetical protein
MNQAPKELTDWVTYIENVRREAHERGRAEGRVEGLEEGYQKGIEAASAAIAGVAETIKGKIVKTPHHPWVEEHSTPAGRIRPRLTETVEWTGEETNREKILRALQAKPGMRPVEIITWLEQNGAEPNTNSISTTIKRMRDIDIEKRGEGWFIRDQVESAA